MVGTRDSVMWQMAVWPFIMLALISRLTFGGLVMPQAAFSDDLTQFAALNILCDSNGVLVGDHNRPQHHHAPLNDGATLLADAGETLDISVGVFMAMTLIVVSACVVWMFPPVRGPPRRHYSSICPQGPPVQV